MDKEKLNLLVKTVDNCIKCKVCNKLNHICYFCYDDFVNIFEVNILDAGIVREDYKSKYMKYAHNIS